MKTIKIKMLPALLLSLLMLTSSFCASNKEKQIQASVTESYVFKHYLKDDNITVQASNSGEVVLEGTVEELSHRSLAEETASAMPGVKKVINKIKLIGDEPTEYSEVWIRMKVKAALMVHKNIDVSAININIRDGKITISGKATTLTQRNLITEYAKDVDGVKEVTNIMSVPANYIMPSETISESIDDASLTALAKMTLLFHKSTHALKTGIETNNGIVVVTGVAQNNAEKELVSKLISDIHGTHRVNNLMTVEAKPAM